VLNDLVERSKTWDWNFASCIQLAEIRKEYHEDRDRRLENPEMVRPSNPRLMARVLDAVANLGDTKGSSARDVLSFIRQSNLSAKNLTVQVTDCYAASCAFNGLHPRDVDASPHANLRIALLRNAKCEMRCVLEIDTSLAWTSILKVEHFEMGIAVSSTKSITVDRSRSRYGQDLKRRCVCFNCSIWSRSNESRSCYFSSANS